MTPSSSQANSTWTAVRGAIHVHSDYADGSGSMTEIVHAASRANLDYLAITDHHAPYARRDGWQGWHDGVLVMVGAEFYSKDKLEVLALDCPKKIKSKGIPMRKVLDEMSAVGWPAFIPHPQGCHDIYIGVLPMLKKWKDFDSGNYAGLEIWDYMHDWIEGYRPWHLPEMCRKHSHRIAGPSAQVLAEWDRVSMKRRVAGIGALDAHGRRLPLRLEHVFKWAKGGILPYSTCFKALATYSLIAGDLHFKAEADTAAVIESLVLARAWVCRDELENGRDFRFVLRDHAGEHQVGSELPFGPGQEFHVSVPAKAQIRLWNRGAVIATVEGRKLAFSPTGPGEYRVECLLDGRSWIYSNHIYLRG